MIKKIMWCVWAVGLCPFGLWAQKNAPALEKDGIVIYTEPSDFGLDLVRAEMEVNAPVERLLEVVTDHDRFKDWSYNCLESRRLEAVSANEFYLWTRTNVPWPVSDRDDVTRQKIARLPGGVIRVELEDFPEKIPPVKGVVRIPYLRGHWVFTPIDGHRTHVEYFIHADPGGNIPSWLANLSVTEAPFETLKAFRKVAEKK